MRGVPGLGLSFGVALALALGCHDPKPTPSPQAGPEARDSTTGGPDGPDGLDDQDAATPPAPVIAPTLRYQEPSPEIVAVVDAPATPQVSLAPDGRTLVLVNQPALPSLAIVGAPFLGLAGERITPRTNERKRSQFHDGLSVVDVATGRTRGITGLPAEPRLGYPDWSPDGQTLAFTHTAEDHVELWVAALDSGVARRLISAPINATLGDGIAWLSGSDRLLVRLVPEARGPAPVGPAIAQGPIVEQSSGRVATNRTYQDLLQSPLDDALFEHYFTAELAVVDLDGTMTKLGTPETGLGVFAELESSPDGEWLRVERLQAPYSRSVPWYLFAKRVELWSLANPNTAPVVLDEQPAAEEIPIEGVRTGPRAFEWQPLEPATLVWAEALDGGDPKQPAEHRDELLRLAAPFVGKTCADGREFTRTTHRYRGLGWLEQPGRYLVTEYDRDRRWQTTHLRGVDEPELGRVLFDRSVHDAYADPGRPVVRQLEDNSWVIRVEGGGEAAAIFLDGDGASATGDRPFLDRLLLAPEAAPQRLFEASPSAWASFVGFAGDTGTLVVRREAPDDPPDWFREDLATGDSTALTTLPHPHPSLTGMDKQLLTYKRRDGVSLSATLYLPPGYDPDTDGRLPLMIWAYPREYIDAGTAGQVRAAPTRFSRVGGSSATVLLLEGYAVLFAAMPVVGDPQTMNDTLLEQLVMSSEAAIDVVVEAGVADRERVAIGGHSYGAFMVANLLAHSDLFKAGVARSGAYNRTLTPFGFQSERRTLWEAADAYVRVSPLFAAAQIDEPILLIHGELDDNSGTFPLQTRRLFHALQGLGGTARMVVLPHEAHGYQARESILHVHYETTQWLATHMKGPAREDAEPSAGG